MHKATCPTCGAEVLVPDTWPPEDDIVAQWLAEECAELVPAEGQGEGHAE